MSPLERRCRRLLWLLPPAERRARGEELVGLLLDLSAHRRRPSLPETASVVVLALRLRMRARAGRLATVLRIALPALVVVAATQSLGRALSLATTPRDWTSATVAYLTLPALAGLLWVLGLRRAALAGWLAAAAFIAFTHVRVLLAFDAGADVLGWWLRTDGVLLAVAVAAATATALGRLDPPRPRVGWIMLLVLAVPVSAATQELTETHVMLSLEPVGWFLAACTAIALTALGGHRWTLALTIPAILVATQIGVFPSWALATTVVAVTGVLVSKTRRPAAHHQPDSGDTPPASAR
jgi:hypothetical protein